MMVKHRLTREGDDYICLRDFPKGILILTHYMASTWRLHILDGLGHYVIRPGLVSKILVTTNNIMTLGCTYATRRLKQTPDIFCKISHIGQLIAWILSRLAWNPALQGTD